ncbi:helix-turn-helix domain-containing protein [Streptomyces sp. NPDC003032]
MRRAWREQGPDALRSCGPARRAQVSAGQFALLGVELLKGTVSRGWSDGRWTLSRVELLIEECLGRILSVRGVWELLRRRGWSCQQPARRAAGQDRAAVAGWVKETWPAAEPPRRRSGHGPSSKTKPPSR